jgi:glutathione S-transferase
MDAFLWHITISHYSEKARWALDYKRVPHRRRYSAGGMHIPVALWLTRGRGYTFPVLKLDGQVYGDSSAIIEVLEERFPEPPLYPEDPAERRRALELEDWFDEHLGPDIRRFVFHELGRDLETFEKVVEQAMPPSLFLGRRSALIGRAFTAARFGAGDAAAADAAREGVLHALDRLERELDGSQYLVGDRFTVADLTAAALFYPMAQPPEGPLEPRELPERLEAFVAPLRERSGYRWVLDTYRRHRQQQSAAVPAGVGSQA